MISKSETDLLGLDATKLPVSSTPVVGSHSLENVDLKTPSPYGQTPSSLSSPHMFKTPGKYVLGHGMSPNRYNRTPSSGRGHKAVLTPRRRFNSGPLYNPFETLDSLHKSTFSPCSTIFYSSSGTSTPGSTSNEQTPQKFRWSIDQQASLFPADIDDMPHQQEHLMSCLGDDRTEEKAQEAIDNFFSSQQIIPSPWTETKTKSRCREIEKEICIAEDGMVTSADQSRVSCGNKKDASCQTTLTMPIDFDLQKILADYYTYHQEESSSGNDSLSSSTLRRKLFFQGGININFCRTDDDDRCDISPQVSPLKSNTPDKRLSHYNSIPITPASTQFSSSPIRTNSPRRRHCSIGSDHLSSPELSPISTPLSSCRTPISGCGPVRKVDFGDFSSEKRRLSCINMGSPDISPIKSETSHHGSDTPAAKRSQIDSSPSKITVVQTEVTPSENNSMSDMDTSNLLPEQGFVPYSSSTHRWALSTIRESSSDGDPETTNQDPSCNLFFNVTASQDTGYNTGSLTNTDGLLHTDLTHQLSSLPLDCNETLPDENCNMDEDYDNNKENFLPCSVGTMEDSAMMMTSGSLWNQNTSHTGQQPESTMGMIFGKQFLMSGKGQRTGLSIMNTNIMNTGGSSSQWQPVVASTPEKIRQQYLGQQIE